jgi:uncharacterized RDD family membrane protein YckC
LRPGALDTLLEAETPEGICLELRPAGVPARFFAFLIDWGIRLALIFGAAQIATLMGGIGTAFWIILLFSLEWLYPVAFELGRAGASPGKSVMGLKVVMDSGLPVTPAASLARNLLRVADFLPMLYGFGILSMLVRRDFKRLGDLAAGTLVVHRPRAVRKVALPEVPVIAPALSLALSEQAAIVALASRASRMTVERLDELAALAAPVVDQPGESGPDVTRRVLGVARWLMGQRA